MEWTAPRERIPERIDLFAALHSKGRGGPTPSTLPSRPMEGTSLPETPPPPNVFGPSATPRLPAAPSTTPSIHPLAPPPLPKASIPSRGPAPKREAARSRPEVAEVADPIKRGASSPAPPPAKWIEYVSPLVRASRKAYMAAPPDVREALDLLLSVPGFLKVSRNVWSGNVGTWTREGYPSEEGNAVLRKAPVLVPWVLSLRAQCWQPWEAGRQYLTAEEMGQLGVAPPEEIEGLPDIFLHPRR